MPDRRGAYLLAVHGRDRYERNLETIRRDEELAARAAKLSAELVKIVPRLVRGREAGKRLVPHTEKVDRWIQGIAEREHELVHEPWRPEDDVGAEETELESEPPVVELEAARVASVLRRLLAQVGDGAPAGTVARLQAAAVMVPAGDLLRLLANGAWNTKARGWGELTSAERASHLVACLEHLRDEAVAVSDVRTRDVRAAHNDPAKGPLPETPTDSHSVGSTNASHS
jgi:hypothetical protein